MQLVKSPADKSLIAMVGSQGICWYSEDCGRNIYALNHGRPINEFQFHPTQKSWGLAAAWTKCDDFVKAPCEIYKELFLTKDIGQNWTVIQNYVVQFSWGWSNLDPVYRNFMPENRIYLTHIPEGKGNQQIQGWTSKIDFVFSDDFFKTKMTPVPRGNKFIIANQYIFVAQVLDEETQDVGLLVSNELMLFKKFQPSELPFKKLREHSYTLLDASEGSIFLHVNHYGDDSKFGNIYISDFSGTRFSTSLLHNVRDSDGQTDFDKVHGLDGIYLANVYDIEYTNQYLKTKGQSNKKYKNKKDSRVDQSFKKTLITFDKGGLWKSLNPPLLDSSGAKNQCEEEECFLHLHSITSQTFGPFYSTQSSVGLIIGVGNVGKHLSNDEDDINTYLSRDGGLNWEEIKKGSYIYEIGDHGALIVMAQDQKATNQVIFSWNEGLSWETLKFSEEKIHVTNIIVDPQSISQNFLLYGRRGEKGIVVGLDFSSLHEPQCKGIENPGGEGSDYELWTANDGRTSQKCLMGRSIQYTRRKRDAECYNGEAFERKQFVTTCECQEADWECDIGYFRQDNTGPCEKIPESKLTSIPDNIEEYCKSSKTSYYIVSQGYRKIPGDLCSGGVSHEALMIPCPGQSA